MKLLILLIICFWGLNLVQAQQLAFPEAEGFGRYALGARGVPNPEVYRVTNLDDAGTGSLRDAVSKPGRIVVFDVGGVIHIKSRIVFSGNSYIAGHTAPGDGIVVYGDGVSFSGADNIIVRYMRFYMGIGGTNGADAATVAHGSNMIFDHCSVLWGRDENFSISGSRTPPANITIQNTLMGQGLISHSCGGLIQTIGGTSIIGCLYIDNQTRNPKVKGLNQFINNVVYNWGGSNGYILADSEGPSWAWMEGNYFISGPGSGLLPYTRARENFQLYAKNNYVDNNKNGILDGEDTPVESYGHTYSRNPPTMVTSLETFSRDNCATCHDISKPFLPMLQPLLSPVEAFNRVVASVGASLPARTEIDKYLIEKLLSLGTNSASFVRNENENIKGMNPLVGVYTGENKKDTDGDGIPDEWEIANGLNPNDPSDALKMAPNGYLNIENYINSIKK